MLQSWSKIIRLPYHNMMGCYTSRSCSLRFCFLTFLTCSLIFQVQLCTRQARLRSQLWRGVSIQRLTDKVLLFLFRAATLLSKQILYHNLSLFCFINIFVFLQIQLWGQQLFLNKNTTPFIMVTPSLLVFHCLSHYPHGLTLIHSRRRELPFVLPDANKKESYIFQVLISVGSVY